MDYDSHTHVDEIFDDDLTNKKQEYTVVKKILIVPHKMLENQIFSHIRVKKYVQHILTYLGRWTKYKRFLSKEAVYFEAMMGDMKCLPWLRSKQSLTA